MSLDFHERLAPDVAAQIPELAERAAAVDQVAPLSEQTLLSLRSPHDARHVVVRSAGRVVGYATVAAATPGHPAMAEVVVDPVARGEGIGTELVAAALAEGEAGRVWAHGKLPAAQGVARRLGLRVARELWQMRRELDAELSASAVPASVRVRPYAGSTDDAELLRVNNAAFHWHPEQGGWTSRDIAVRTAEPWFDPEGLFLAFAAEDPTRLLGFHWTKMHAEQHPPVGEVYIVGIDPAAQGQGLGRLLTLAGLRYLQDRGLTEVMLYTEADNAAAVRTYRSLGFTLAHTDVAYARG